MYNKIVQGTYGKPIGVMTNDRNPVNSLSTELWYNINKPCAYNADKKAETFDDVLEDFTSFQENDGYGHQPDSYKAKYQLFSYWIRIL